MEGRAWPLQLRTFSLLRSPWSLLQRFHDVYPPEAWLLHYYPQVYFAKLVTRRLALNTRLDKSMQSQQNETKGTTLFKITPGFEVSALSIVVLGSLCYTFLVYYYYFFDRHFRFRKKNSADSQLEKSSSTQEDNPYGFANPVPAKLLETSPETGLSQDEVIVRRENYGHNETWKRRNWFLVFRRLCIGLTNLIFQATALSSLVARDWVDLLITCSLLAYNVWFSVESVRQYDDLGQSIALNSSIPAVTLRDGRIVKIPLKELVPGDIVHVSEGSIIPADCQVTTHSYGDLCIDQSSITGENTGIEKHYGDTCYAGSGVLRGDAFLTVVAIGHQTFLGRTLSIISDPAPESITPVKISQTPRQQREFHWVIHCIGTAICVLVASAFFIIWKFVNRSGLSDIAQEVCIAIVLVAVLASLTTNISCFRARGAARLVDNGVIVQSTMSDAELLAGIDILCVDKTGTMTENRLTLLEPYAASSDPEDVMLIACLTISSDTKNLDAIDKTFLRALKHYPRARDSVGRYKIIDHEPFNVETKRMLSLVEAPSGERIFCTKGAPLYVLDICERDNPDTQDLSKKYKNMAANFASRGLRCLGVARKHENHKWELLGLVPLFDPPRFDSAAALKMATTLGISVRMFTGDAVAIAREIARSISMGTNSLNANSIGDDKLLSDPETSTLVEQAVVYAEVFPHLKEKIVRTLQSRGHLVAATGDGVNDSPTLRRADCGIAVEGASEMAQSAANIIFLKPGFASMVQAVEKSRQIFQLTYTYIIYRTAVSLYLVIFLLYYFINYYETLDLNLLILTIHLSDIIGIALRYDDKTTPYPKSPARWSTWKLFPSVVLLSTILMLGTWAAITTIPDQIVHSATNSAEALAIRTQIAFLQIVLSSHWLVLLTRTNGRFWVHTQCWQLLMTILFIDLGATLLCTLGWVGNSHMMTLRAVCWVWSYSFGTICLAAGLLCQLVDESMAERQIRGKKGVKEGSSSEH